MKKNCNKLHLYLKHVANAVHCSQNPVQGGQFREQVVAKRRRIKPVKKAEESASTGKNDAPDS